MLLEIDNSELVHMLEHQESLKSKVEEAVAVLQAHNKEWLRHKTENILFLIASTWKKYHKKIEKLQLKPKNHYRPRWDIMFWTFYSSLPPSIPF